MFSSLSLILLFVVFHSAVFYNKEEVLYFKRKGDILINDYI